MTLEDIGDIGSFLAGISIVFLAINYYSALKEKRKNQYREKMERTFSLVSRFKNFYDDSTLLNITNFTRNIIERKPENELHIYDKKQGGKDVVGWEYTTKLVVLDNCMKDLYLYLKEVSYVLTQNKKYELVDEEELRSYLNSFSIQLKEFFIAADIRMVDQYRFNNRADYFGEINRMDFQQTKKIILQHFDFLR